MSAEIRVNRRTFTRFKQIDLTVSLDTFARECRIVTTDAPAGNLSLKTDDLITVLLDKKAVLKGYIEKANEPESRSSHEISFTARDLVADLIDSAVPENVKALENVNTYKELVQQCIDGLKLTDTIKIIDEIGAVFSDSAKLKAASSGQTCGDFLQENARIVQVFLNTDGEGNVLIRKPKGKLTTVLQNIPNASNNNIISSTLDIDKSKRFYKYTVFSNSSLTASNSSRNNLNNQGSAIDKEIRKSRVFEKIAESPMTSKECAEAAAEEANIRRARSFNYNCTVAGFTANDELWEPGKEVTIKDTIKGVNGLFQVNEVSYTFSADGEKSAMTITLPDKGTIEPEPTPVVQRTTTPGSKLNTLPPVTATRNELRAERLFNESFVGTKVKDERVDLSNPWNRVPK